MSGSAAENTQEVVDPNQIVVADKAENPGASAENVDGANKAKVDEWAMAQLKDNGTPWNEKTSAEKVNTVVQTVVKIFLVLLLLYMFIISLSLMGGAFKVVGGKTSGKAFRQSELFDNPVAGLSLGILVTVLVQSSSTSTSIIITMTAAGLLSLKNSVPMIMGANIGTAVTASIVSVGSIGDRDQYRRAFSGAIVHYCFNVLTVVILLPIEVATGMLMHMAEAITVNIDDSGESGGKQDFLKKITKPVTSRLLQVDKKLVSNIAAETDPEELAKLEKASMIVQDQSKDTHLFMDTPMTDEQAGAVLLVVSLVFLCVCLTLLVKTLQSVFKGRAAMWIGKMLNLEIKSLPLIADYILMVFGMGLTILMQSSSVTTSTLTPLVGIGLIRVEKMFPFTIGANIGTTVTGVLAALASTDIQVGMQVALTHLLFNGFGTLMWFMVPSLRAAPLSMAKFLGKLASEVKIFPILLIIFAWVLAPGVLLLLAIAGPAVCGVVGGAFLLAVALVIFIIWARAWFPTKLPQFLQQNKDWMPTTLRVNDGKEAPANVQEVIVEQGASAEDGKTLVVKPWWQAPHAWGTGYFLLSFLWLAVPNNQWGNVKYTKFDGREHIGIGSKSVCSKMYEEDMDWAPARRMLDQTEFEQCGAITGCKDHEAFSDEPGANTLYEKSWTKCRENCTIADWESFCIGLSCTGSSHTEQCLNVTGALHQRFQVNYQTGSQAAWKKGARCRPVDEFCDNAATLSKIGDLGWCGIAFAMLGQLLLLVYLVKHKSADMFKALIGSVGSFVLSWVFLLATWASWASAGGEDVTCTLVDASATGAVVATGKFSDIIMGSGGFSYMIVLISWFFMTLMLGVLVHRMYVDYVEKRK